MTDQQIKTFFSFDETDLNANRSNKLSAKQEKKFKELEKSTSNIFRWIGIGLILLATCIIGFILLNVINDGFSFATAFSEDIIGIVLMLCLPTFIIGIFVWVMFWLASSKTDYAVQNIQGKINFVKVEKQVRNASNSTYQTVEQYELRVGGIVFENVASDLLNLIDEGDIYIFYYTKQSKQILSCEFISKEK